MDFTSTTTLSIQKDLRKTSGETLLAVLGLRSLYLIYGKNTWQAASGLLSKDYVATDTIRKCLHDLVKILDDETRLPAPHVSLSAAFTWRVYETISAIATSVDDEAIIDLTITLFNDLVDSEQEEFVSNPGFSKALMNFAEHISGPNGVIVSEDTIARITELLFGIATKIRLQPELLSAWFSFSNSGSQDGKDLDDNERSKFVGALHKDDFPLFYVLRDLWHHEGKIGEFARMGVLYMIEASAHSEDLERWIVESDLATLMASGLGAQYSQLSRKAEYTIPSGQLPPVLAYSDYKATQPSEHDVESHREYYGSMETFISHLMFWQDVLEHCPSYEIKQTLLDHFQALFLQQLLYPSLLESSDFDGGSQAAVFNYLRRILESIDHPDLIHSILHYLLALPDDPKPVPKSSSSRRRRVSESRRKSLLLLQMVAEKDEQDSPTLFTLVDLIKGGLRSKSQQTVAATLKLVSIILRKFHKYAMFTMLKVLPAAAESQRTIGGLHAELELFMGLAESITQDESLEISYDAHLKDEMSLIESHPCTMQVLASNYGDWKSKEADQANFGPRAVIPHRLLAEDPVLKSLLMLLDTFFSNSVEVNLSLTGAITDLASCAHMHLEGWLLVDPFAYEYDVDEVDEDAQDDDLGSELKELDELLSLANSPAQAHLHSIKKIRQAPSWSKEKTPPVIARLQDTVSMLDVWRAEIPNFDSLLAQRRELFFSDKVKSRASSRSPNTRAGFNQTPQTPRRSEESVNRPFVSSPSSHRLESISQRILGDPLSRSSSPGRPLRVRERNDLDADNSSSLSGKLGLSSKATVRSRSPAMPGSEIGKSKSQSSFKRMLAPPQHHRKRSLGDSLFGENDELLRRKIMIPVGRGDVENRSASDGPPLSVYGESETSSIKSGNEGHHTLAAFNSIDQGSSAGETNNNNNQDETPEDASKDAEPETTEGLNSHKGDGQNSKNVKEVSLNHLLTNAILLQEFILELAALVQVRAGLLEEVRFI
ncbi:MAG: hypothetical protein M1834_002161 [Cirrosporium novae-zelandiae]|nr:MAG: hypothetical protein M1834_002161 [Cirrosporium novae-zelandiae]